MSPTRELRRFDESPAFADMLRWWNDSIWSPLTGRAGVPAMDVWTEGDRFVIRTTLSQFDKKDVSVETRDREIVISARRKETDEDKRTYIVRETHDEFTRTISVPSRADLSGIAASFTDGTLTVTVPLKEQITATTVPIS